MKKEETLLMSLHNIEWFKENEVMTLINDLRNKYNDDPINIISYNPIGYVCNIEAISNFYEDNLLKLASVICRSIIQGHPLQDGNKRFGMYLATYFLALNNIKITADNESYVSLALSIAKDEVNLDRICEWFCNNTLNFE